VGESKKDTLRSMSGPVAWIEPDPVTRTLQVRGSIEGVTLVVTDPATGMEINTPEKLYEHGWLITPNGFLQSRLDGFYETIPLFDERGQPLRIEVSNLYPGVQKVAVQYFDQPFDMASTWGFSGSAQLEGGQGTSLDHVSGRLIRGLGGHDQSSLYERGLGQTGVADKPVEKIAFTVVKGMWSKQMTIGAVRIETEPSMEVAITNTPRPAQRAVRERLQQFGPAAENGGKAYFAAVLPSVAKVKPKSFTGLKPAWLSAGANLAAARNDSESFQILLYHPERELADVTWTVEGPTGPDGAVAADLEILVAPIGYVRQIGNPYDVANYGWRPEPILTFMKSVTVRPADAQTLWVRVSVPATATPGTYRGAVVLQPAGLPPHRVPFELEVWDIERPPMPYLKVVVGIYPVEHYEFLMDHGVNPSHIYGRSAFGLAEDEALPILKNWAERGVTAVNLDYVDYRDKPAPTADELKKLVDEVERSYELAKKAGLGDAAYLYMFDEANPSDYPTMKTIVDAVRARMPNLQMATTAYWGKDLDFGTEAGVDIDIWCPIVQHFRNPDLANAARQHGRDIWWYTCGYPTPPMPNFNAESSGMENRMLMGLTPHAFRVSGFLYYAFQMDEPRGIRVTEGPYTPLSFSGVCNGWFYLNGAGGLDDPLPSLRMENLRAGLEDYDLIAIARNHQAELEEAGKTLDLKAAEVLKQLNTVPNPYVRSVIDYCRDPQELEALRRDLAEYIRQARKLLR
jgi:hypothetical protein